jgi:hypothetical protein
MGENPRAMRAITLTRALPALLALVLFAALAGCGSDSSGETSTAASVSIPTPTSPIPTATTPSTTTPGKKGETTTANGGVSPAACSVPDAFQNFKYTGIDCTAAVAVGTAWDQNGKDCNTVDNPNVDEGYHRTCSVEGFTCTAKRDVHSDGRFVTCTQGGQSIRFTWLPA